MKYLSWIAFYEGPTDSRYFGALIPRLIEDLLAARAKHSSAVSPTPVQPIAPVNRNPQTIAEAICALRDALDIVFVHGDTGGRGQARTIQERTGAVCQQANDLCEWPTDQCIVVAPKKEMEAWALADPNAVCAALGYTGLPGELELPANGQAAERLPDAKQALDNAIEIARGRRRRGGDFELLTTIASRQNFARLRETPSFRPFEEAITQCLLKLDFIQ